MDGNPLSQALQRGRDDDDEKRRCTMYKHPLPPATRPSKVKMRHDRHVPINEQENRKGKNLFHQKLSGPTSSNEEEKDNVGRQSKPCPAMHALAPSNPTQPNPISAMHMPRYPHPSRGDEIHTCTSRTDPMLCLCFPGSIPVSLFCPCKPSLLSSGARG